MINCSYPLTPFPVCHVGESEGTLLQPKRVFEPNNYEPKLNIIEYGRLSAAIWYPEDGDLYLKNNGRQLKVQYDSPCVPFLSPNTITPYDHTPEHGKQHLKYTVDENFRYFKSNFFQTYIPVPTMVENLMDNIKNKKETQAIQPCQGSVISYIPSWTDDTVITGYLLFAGGPNLNELNIVVLMSKPPSVDPPVSQYTSYIIAQGHLNLGYAEAFLCPGRIMEVVGHNVQERMFVGVRCNHHIVLLEGPTCRSEERLLQMVENIPPSMMMESPLSLLTVLTVYQSSVLTSSLALSPYIFGEAVLVTESGGVYLWEDDDGISTIQDPIEVSEVSHYWQCVFGPHPRIIVLAEQTGVSSVEFIDEIPTYKTIIDKDSPFLIVTCIARHPLHPFYLFVATTEMVLLFDMRQTNEPLLEIRHELRKDVRLINVICCPWQLDHTLVMMSTLHNPKSHVYVIKGGYTFNDQGPPPPCIAITPHAVDTYSYMLSQLHLSPCPVQWRLSQSLVGACLVPVSSSKSYCGLTVSSVGDIFLQSWHYGDQPICSPAVPHLPRECGLWIEEVLTQDKDLQKLFDNNHNILTWEMGTIMDYVSSLLSDKGLCPRCVVLLEEGGPFNDVTPPELPPLPASILNGVANVWKCPLCYEDVMTSKEKKSLFHSNDQDNDIDGMDVLRQFSNEKEGEPPSDYEEINRLWKLWVSPEEKEKGVALEEEEVGVSRTPQSKQEGKESPPLNVSQSLSLSQPKTKQRKLGF